MGIEVDIIKDIEWKQLIWYGHVQRMPVERLHIQAIEWQPTGTQRRRRAKVERQKAIQKLMSERNLTTEDCENRKQ